jgi:putative PIG3 family NAD(P)H quinone oxidoreductase
MQVVEITRPGGPEVLKPATRPVPQPRAGEVLIEVAAAGVNRPDCLQRAGAYAPPPGASDLPGLEVAGTVARLGEGVSQWNIGDQVCALTPGGGYAQYCVTPAAHCLPVPRGLDPIQAASLPETFFTVWINVFERARLAPGETLLVQGGSSGIGVTAIQMARAFGHRVFATAGSAEKCAACEQLGAERGINYRVEDFVDAVKQLTGVPGRHQGDARHERYPVPQAHHYRLDAAPAQRRVQGRRGAGATPARVAADRRRHHPPGDLPHFPARAGGSGARADGVRRARRQDRAGSAE